MTDQSQPLAKSFEPATIEQKWGVTWEAMSVFRVTLEAGKPDFCIQLPPPNMTGTLHMGHVFNQTTMDSLARHVRTAGANTLQAPGTDHAGITTRIIVKRQLDAQSVSCRDMGRGRFVEKVWKWKE